MRRAILSFPNMFEDEHYFSSGVYVETGNETEDDIEFMLFPVMSLTITIEPSCRCAVEISYPDEFAPTMSNLRTHELVRVYRLLQGKQAEEFCAAHRGFDVPFMVPKNLDIDQLF